MLSVPQRGCQPQSSHWLLDKRSKEGTTCCPGFSLKSHTKHPRGVPMKNTLAIFLGNCSCHPQDGGFRSEGHSTFLSFPGAPRASSILFSKLFPVRIGTSHVLFFPSFFFFFKIDEEMEEKRSIMTKVTLKIREA